MKTYIVILTWNNADDFQRCTRSVGMNTLTPCKLIVIENGSRPEQRAEIKRIYDRLYDVPWACLDTAHYHEAAFNEGIPVGQNRALDWLAEYETEPYGVVLLDADTTVEFDWIDHILNYARQHPDVGIVGAAKSPSGMSHPVYHHTDGRWYVHDLQCQDPSGFMDGESVDFACAYLRPELMARGLRMDEGYELYDGHDQDLTFRVRSWGYRVVQLHDAVVLHYGSAAMKANGYNWSGGGRQEWSELRARNTKRFVDIWEPFLAGRRKSVAEEMEHMREMNAKLVAEAGDRKEVP